MKNLKFLTIALATFVFGIITVSASTTSEALDAVTITSNVGSAATFQKSYNEADDLIEVTERLTSFDDATINAALDQRPGVGGWLAYVYTQVINAHSDTYWKQNQFFSRTTTTPIEEQKETVRQKLLDDTASSHENVWVSAVYIQYKNGDNWTFTTEAGGSGKSNRTYLAEKLGISENELVYGENFRFAMRDEHNGLFIYANAQENADKEIWIRTTFDVRNNFKIASTNGTLYVYHKTLDDALTNGYDNVIINEDVTVDNLTVPEGKIITLQNGATLNVTESAVVNGRVTDGTNNYYAITVGDHANGTLTVTGSKLRAEGSEVEVTITPNDGYTLEYAAVVSTNNNYTDINNNKFTMPSNSVTVNAYFIEHEDISTYIEEIDSNERKEYTDIGAANASEMEQILLEELENSDLEYDANTNNIIIFADMYEIDPEDIDDIVKENIISKIQNKFPDAKINNYFDVEIDVISNYRYIGSLTDLNHKIAIKVVLPNTIPDVADGYIRTYYIIRQHGDQYEILDTVLASDGNSLTFESDKFSTFALAYVDTKVENTNTDTITSPKTYDNISLYITLAGISVIGIAGIYVSKKKLYNK